MRNWTGSICLIGIVLVVLLEVCLITTGNDVPTVRQREGYNAGRAGVPVEACPYKGYDGERWKKGWQQGYQERQTDREQHQTPRQNQDPRNNHDRNSLPEKR